MSIPTNISIKPRIDGYLSFDVVLTFADGAKHCIRLSARDEIKWMPREFLMLDEKAVRGMLEHYIDELDEKKKKETAPQQD